MSNSMTHTRREHRSSLIGSPAVATAASAAPSLVGLRTRICCHLSASRHRHGNRQEAGQEVEAVFVVVAEEEIPAGLFCFVFFPEDDPSAATKNGTFFICRTGRLNVHTHTHTHPLWGQLVATC